MTDTAEIEVLDHRSALARYSRDVSAHYGDRVVGMFLFGSRARAEHRPDSDADVAVVLEDGHWQFWAEKRVLAGIAFDTLMEHGLMIQPWPISRSEWQEPTGVSRERLIRNMKKDAVSVLVPA